MSHYRSQDPDDAEAALAAIFADNDGAVRCPVPGCEELTFFSRWQTLWDHFQQEHKKDFYAAFKRKYHRHFSEHNGHSLTQGIKALMLASFDRPTSAEAVSKESLKPKPKIAPTLAELTERFVNASPAARQQKLPEIISSSSKEHSEKNTNTTSSNLSTRDNNMTAPITTSKSYYNDNHGAFRTLSTKIRKDPKMDIEWRGRELEKFTKIFHGMPPCFHCNARVGNQIHHQHPLFFNIIVIALNQQSTTAEAVIKDYAEGNTVLFDRVLKNVYDYHMEEGRVITAPYCRDCNQDAEHKRRIKIEKN